MSNKNNTNSNSNNSLPSSFTQFRSPQQSQQMGSQMQFDPFAPVQQQQTQQVQQQQQQQQQLLQQLQQQVAQQQQLLQLQTLQLQQLQQVQGAPTQQQQQQQQTPQIQGAPPSSYGFPQPPQPSQPNPYRFQGSFPFPPRAPTQMPYPPVNSKISTNMQRGNLQRPIRAAPDVGFNGLYLHLILDESGSMDSVRDLTIKNFNSYIKTQQDQRIVPEGAEGAPSSSSSSTETETKSTDNIQGDKVSVSLTKFDAPQIIDVYKNTPLAEVPLLSRETYKPNGGTNMLDAVGVVIQQIDDILLAQAETEQRPAVLVVIMTDGHENQSHSFSMETIKAMITARQEKGWTFVFMGANIDAWGAAAQVGISQNNAFNFSVRSEDALQSLSSATAQYRAFNSCQQAQAQRSPEPSSERMQQYQQAQQSYAFFSPQVRAQYESPPAQKF